MPRQNSIDPKLQVEPVLSTRRKWLHRVGWASLATLGLGASAAYARYVEPHWLQIVQRDLPVSRLPLSWHGKLLAQISDVHVGHQVSDEYLIESFRRLAGLKPEIVVVTGDFVTGRPRSDFSEDHFHAVYANLPHGAAATLGVLGNHDYGPSWSDANAAARLVELLAAHGLTVLRNQTHDVDGLQVVGLDELWAGRCDASAALATSSRLAPRLVLCHNPDAADRKMWRGYQGWILSGHTHGGQCRPPFLPPPLLPVANRRYTAGEFDLFDGRRMYINRGLGHTLQVRFNVRPEITLFRLVAAPA